MPVKCDCGPSCRLQRRFLCGFVESAIMPGSIIVTDDRSGDVSLRKRGYDDDAIAESDPEIAKQFMPMIHSSSPLENTAQLHPRWGPIYLVPCPGHSV